MTTLADELSKPQYQGLSDQQAADAINAKTVVVLQSVPIAKIKEYAIVNSIWPKLKAGRASSNSQVAGLCDSVFDWIEDPRIGTLDVNLDKVKTMLSGLVAASIITESQKADVIAMGAKSVSWTSTVGLPEIGIGLVKNARKEIAGVNL
jgi:hypothetical protein